MDIAWNKWSPNTQLEGCFFYRTSIANEKGLSFHFSKSLNSNIDLKITFLTWIYSHNILALSFPIQHEWCFLRTMASPYIDWIAQESLQTKPNKIYHLRIITYETIIDIITPNMPQVITM